MVSRNNRRGLAAWARNGSVWTRTTYHSSAMGRRILVNVDHGETRVAVLQDDTLFDFALERDDRLVGNLYKGRVVNVLPGMDAAFVDIGLSRNAFIYVTDISAEARTAVNPHEQPSHRYGSILEAAQVGESILVQVVRPPFGNKGARVTTRLSLPGRYAVLLIHTSEHAGISRQIEDEEERERLRRITEQNRPLDYGLILRTEAEGRSENELRKDIESLVVLWKSLEERFKEAPCPAEIHHDQGLVGRVVRDMLTAEVSELLIDSPESYELLVRQLNHDAPHLVSKVKLYSEEVPLFEHFELEAEISRTLSRVVSLPRGGNVTIDQTEALTSIDVDTGKFVGKTHLADTVLRTNLEAVEEITRQLRLRDIGGIIVIDFIDMDRVRDRIRIMNALESALRKDRTKTKIVSLSPLGLVEMTRRRRGRSLTDLLCKPCPYCSGRGHVRTAETVAIDLRRKLRRAARRSGEDALFVRCHPEVAAVLVGPDGDHARKMETETGKSLHLRVDPEGHLERSEIRPGPESDLRGADEPLTVGEAVALDRHTRTYPEGSLAFAAHRHQLVELPELADASLESVRLRIREVGRWFAVAEVSEAQIPPPQAADEATSSESSTSIIRPGGT